ncbi:MAG: DUF3108 domain-containing protein [Calditrichales bacterium]|nr:MAG: DUF3108 domain-containing protein [Calditrichales bacterium]
MSFFDQNKMNPSLFFIIFFHNLMTRKTCAVLIDLLWFIIGISMVMNFFYTVLTVMMSFFSSDSLTIQNSVAVDSSGMQTVVAESVKTSVPTKKKLVYPKIKNNAFSVGEKLTFKVRYGVVRAGTATMSVLKETKVQDHPVYQIQTTAVSDAPFSWVFSVNDVVNSFIDREGLFSWRFEKKLREGNYEMDLLVDYSPQDSLARVKYIRYKDDVERLNYDVKAPPFVLDILASFYYIRTRDLNVGDVISITNHDNKKIYDLEVQVYMRETISTAAGKFRCLRVEPLLKGEGIFKQKGRLLVWVTDDEFKIPVQMTSEVVVGHITTELEKIEGIPGPIPARISK